MQTRGGARGAAPRYAIRKSPLRLFRRRLHARGRLRPGDAKALLEHLLLRLLHQVEVADVQLERALPVRHRLSVTAQLRGADRHPAPRRGGVRISPDQGTDLEDSLTAPALLP